MMTAPTTAAAPKSKLGAVTKGRLKMPHRYVFYGGEGVGKSTLAAHAPDPIFLDIEDGSGHLDVARYPFRPGEPAAHVPRNYADVIAGLHDLAAAEHPYKTLVVDSVDRVEALIHAHIVAQHSKRVTFINKGGKEMRSIQDFGYGKGFDLELDEWRALCQLLDGLRRRGMNVVLIGHAMIRSFKNPEGDDFDRYSLRVHDKSAGFIKEWADVMGFCCFEQSASRGPDGEGKVLGFATGRRLIKLERTAAYDAKTRLPLPGLVQLGTDDPWAPLAAAVEAAMLMDPKTILAAIKVELDRIGDTELTAKVSTACRDAAGSAEKLWRYLTDLQKRGAAAQEENNHV